MEKCFKFLTLITVVGLIGGCRGLNKKETETTAVVVKTQGSIVVDGKLNEAAWEKTPFQQLSLLNTWKKLPAETVKVIKRDDFESGKVKFLYDDKYLYIGIKFHDSDVIAKSSENQTFLIRAGDLAEIFLKPQDASYYWELYVTPRGNKCSYFYPSHGYLGLSSIYAKKALMPGLRTAAYTCGTINNNKDADCFWTAEMAVPLSEIARAGIPFSPERSWSIMVSRYNYSRKLRTKQLSSFPKLPYVNFHLLEYYAPMRFIQN
jgi:hypothetical protein